MTIFNVFSLLGGLALFLFGMDIMGKALEKQAGGQLQKILSISSRFCAIPYSPLSNCSSSPAMHFSRPLARAMPSPTIMTVPVSLCSMAFS